MKTATCHPDRKHKARGLCRPCYDRTTKANKSLPSEKRCPKCNTVKPASEFHIIHSRNELFAYCKSCDLIRANSPKRKLQQRKWRAANRDRARYYGIKTKYGLNREQFQDMLQQQDYRCTICQCNLMELPDRELCVDHDHSCCTTQRTCGKCVRSILCGKCNRILGTIENNVGLLPVMLEYLKYHGQKALEDAIRNNLK